MSLQAIADRLGSPHMELSYDDLERFRGPIVYVWTRERRAGDGAAAVSKTPRAAKKLDQARLFLALLRAENAKVIGKDGRGVEAYTSACLGALKSAVYRLRNEVGRAAFTVGESRFKGGLDRVERRRYDRMMNQRDFDVHEGDLPTTTAERAIPAHLAPRGVQFFAPPGVLVPNPVPGGEPAFSIGWVIAQEVHLDAAAVETTCARYVDLVARLLAAFQ